MNGRAAQADHPKEMRQTTVSQLSQPTNRPPTDSATAHAQTYQHVPFGVLPASNATQNSATETASRLPYDSDLFSRLPTANPLGQHTSLGSPSFQARATSVPSYDPGYADSSRNGMITQQQHQQQHQQIQNLVQSRGNTAYTPQLQAAEHRTQSAVPSLSFQSNPSAGDLMQNQQVQRDKTKLQIPTSSNPAPIPYDTEQNPVIETEDASEGRMLLVERADTARRREGEDPEEDDHVTEHYRGASSGIPSLHALRHHSDDGPAQLHKRARASSTSASQSRPGQMDYYTSSEYSRNVVGYGDSLRTQADERGVFVEDERDHFTLPPIRLLSSHSGGDALGSPNFPVHVPKGLFDRLIS